MIRVELDRVLGGAWYVRLPVNERALPPGLRGASRLPLRVQREAAWLVHDSERLLELQRGPLSVQCQCLWRDGLSRGTVLVAPAALQRTPSRRGRGAVATPSAARV
jgi:hypothetical protein